MKSGESSVPVDANEEIPALIEKLLESERRLEELTAGEVDTVAGRDGRTFLLRRTQDQLRIREAARQESILNALPAHIALLDAQGVIVSVNEAWRGFTGTAVVQRPGYAVGVNYLKICASAQGVGAAEAHEVARAIQSVLAAETESYSIEYACHSPTEQRWFLLTATPLPERSPNGVVLMHSSVTERKLAELSMHRSQKRLRDLMDGLGPSMFVGLLTPQGILVDINRSPLEVAGVKAEDVLGKPFEATPWWAHSAEAQQQLREAMARAARGEASRYDVRISGAENQIVDVDFSLQPLRDETGVITFLIPSACVITERKQAETALRASEAEFRLLADAMPQIVWITRPDGWNVFFNQRWIDYTGLTHEESYGSGWNKPFHPEDQERAWRAWAYATTTSGVYSIECRLRRADGVYRWWLIRGVPQPDVTGKILKWFGTCTDIHDLKLAELEIVRTNLALQQQQSELRILIDLMPAMIAFKDTNNVLRRVNQRFAQSVGKSVAELEGRSSIEVFGGNAAKFDAEDLKVTQSGKPEMGTIKSSRNRDGREIWHQIDKVPVCDTDGKVVGLVVMAQDITEGKESSEALRVSEKRFKALFEQAAVGVAVTDAATGRFVQVNQHFCELAGRTREELEQVTFAAITHPKDIPRSLEMMRQLKEGPARESADEKRYLRKDGAEVWVNVTVSPMWAPGETPDYFIAVALDVTARKHLEEQFRQAQKMEAIGTLAGGIAHDFNNVLAAINGYTELAKMESGGNATVLEYLNAVLHGAKRATDLVRQILAFSRQQKLERKPIQLRQVVEEALKLLRATIPATIDFEISLANQAPNVLADASQVHQVLMNLCTNAAHAMGDIPGRLGVKIEKFEVDHHLALARPGLRSGPYVRLSISDTGRGMEEATMRRIFEPFFTTKAPGEGTGLGLAVVHGIMQSHEGAVTVYSHVGEGTTFHLYFPVHTSGEVEPVTADTLAPWGQGERILYVDDEATLAMMGRKILERLGYIVHTCTHAMEALALVRAQPGAYDLVVTDQMMPGMTGTSLAEKIQAIRADMPIILTTGYSAILTPERIREMGIRKLLLKPLTFDSLGAAVGSVLAESKPK